MNAISGIARSVIDGLATLFLVITVLFFALRTVPGDPALVLLGDYYTPELYQQLRGKLGLDSPLHTQYFIYLKDLVRGEWGNSVRTSTPVIRELASAYPHTLYLALAATAFAVAVGIPLGALAGNRPGSSLDSFVTTISIFALANPSFVLGIVMVVVFSIGLNWFPMMGSGQGGGLTDQLWHLVLPSLALGLRMAGQVSRVCRAEMALARSSDYVRTARAKGVSESVIFIRHTLRTTLIPVVTFLGLILTNLLAGAAVTEIVFSRPGLGRLLVSSILTRDFPLILGSVIVFASTVVVVNTILDVAYKLLDPRLRV